MQVTDLSRTINHILVGMLGLIAIAFLFWKRLITIAIFLYQQPQLQVLEPKDVASLAPLVAAILLVLTPAFLAIAFLLGLAFEGFSDLLIDRLLIYGVIYKSTFVQKLFFSGKGYALNAQLRARYEKLLQESKRYTIADFIPEERRTVAASLYFQNASQDSIKWTLYNYTVYLLAAGFALILVLFLVGVLVNGLSWYWSIPLLFLLYALIFVAADRERYSYEAIYRHVIVFLSEKDKEPETSREETAKQLPVVENNAALTSLSQTGGKHQRTDRRR
jgi:hypothetical protein